MDKWNLIIDVALCENCNNCALAAKDEHVGNDFPGYSAPHESSGESVVKIHRKVRGSGSQVDAAYLPSLCNHCDDAPCVKAGGGAVRKRDDGIVIIDPLKAKGRRDLVDACPYHAIVWNEEQQLPQTWIFDAHLLDQGWKVPRCVQVCPTRAMEAVKLSDQAMARRASTEQLAVLRPELGTRPRVYYQNLYRYSHCFVGGEVCALVNGVEECVEDAKVSLSRDGAAAMQSRTGAFGEFRFDGLLPESGEYEITVDHPLHGAATARVQLGAQSVSLEAIRLGPVAGE
ncbi:4Fe-4S dicluster domain-containing protein [Hydrocarboniphaga sp.]|uniref:4Fe-4S dicluster domain-containing protein n=1 Tax=Hydrocarboniphaga sp. TaxID=2033016 RepID=UPI003D128C70